MAAGRLTDILRRVTTFGVTLARLDLRQEAERHTAAVDWIAQAAGLGRYAVLSEPDRQRLLVQHLAAGDVRLDDLPRATSDDQVRDVLDTFRVAARIHPESLGAYVITMASAPSDVLAVEFLQVAAGTSHPQRVVPLFETARDLEHAGAIMSDLLAIPWYRDRINGHQEWDGIPFAKGCRSHERRLALYWRRKRSSGVREERAAQTQVHGEAAYRPRGGPRTRIQSQPPARFGDPRADRAGRNEPGQIGLVECDSPLG